MELNKVYLGDSLSVLRDFPDESIDCCVTSPPYYGLRDYGTGTWIGGDPNCNHYRDTKASEHTATGHRRMQEAGAAVGDAIYKTVCPKCGAVRVDNQIGLEETPEKYIEKLVSLFREVRRVLKKDGTLWVNIGDSYAGPGKGGAMYPDNAMNYKPKDLIGIPWMLAFALRADGWYLRQDIIWAKPNPMPESVTDRCVKSHEYIFLLSKSKKYYFDYQAIQEEAVTNEERPGGIVREREYGYDSKRNLHPEAYLSSAPKFGGNKYGANDDSHFSTYSGKEWNPQTKDGQIMRNKRDVWSVNVSPTKEAHFATYPQKLIEPCIIAGCPMGGGSIGPFHGQWNYRYCCKEA